MRAILPAVVCGLALSACGGLENEPLGYGLIRGALVGGSSSSTVSVYGSPDLIVSPDSTGHFSLRVPVGQMDVLALISSTAAARIPVQVPGGGVADLGTQIGAPPGVLELELKAPSHQALTKGSVKAEGTPLSIRLEEAGEWVFRLPVGCYQVQGSVPGLGTISTQGCAVEGHHSEIEFRFPEPDGSAGREGCAVTGCDPGYVCQASGACIL